MAQRIGVLAGQGSVMTYDFWSFGWQVTTRAGVTRDPLFTNQFRAILRSGGVQLVRLPARSPNLNALAERFVLSIKSECLDRMIPLGERHLRLAIDEYAEHCHFERPHQGLGSRLIDGGPETRAGPVHRRERLGGLLSSYHREAA